MSFSEKCTTDCVVCTENFNKTTRKPITCGYCQYTACRNCCEKYILGTYEDPQCMQCRKSWTRAFLCNNFTQVFILNKFREHRENVLMEKERALMAYTQPYVEMAIHADTFLVDIKAKQTEMQIIDSKIKLLYQNRRKIEDEARALRAKRDRCLDPNSVSKTDRAQFVRKCTAPECRGFLSTQWKCGVCSLWSCPECLEVKGPVRDVEHTCNPDTVATAKLIASDTKTCPKCNTGIYKTEGCDVMFCVECHTAFNWKTRAIITKNIHNPHYFEWRARIGTEERTPGDIICGREIDNEFAVQLSHKCKRIARNIGTSVDAVIPITNIIRDIYKVRGWVVCLNAIVRSLMELQDHILPPDVQNNLQLRISYMRNKISIGELKSAIQSRERLSEKGQELSQVYTMTVQCATEILYRLSSSITALGDVAGLQDSMIEIIYSTFTELEALREYTNQCLTNVARVFGGSVKLLGVIFSLGMSYEAVGDNFKEVMFSTGTCTQKLRAAKALAAYASSTSSATSQLKAGNA